MSRLASYIFIAINVVIISNVTANPLVEIESGKINGKILTNYKGGEFYGFMGIPYAQPPLGDLRFKPPLPAKPWKDVLNATQPGAQCPQGFFLFHDTSGSEDCLFLNVYTKNVTQDSLKPVMVFIHGGGFSVGAGNHKFHAPDYLMTQDIVLVTINYRLGFLGFLSFEDPSVGVSGNMGLKDQVLALKWVQKNIKNFGGDPRSVTIFGISAGGASAHYLVLSPAAKGLFDRAIMQSGCALNTWAICRNLDKEGWSSIGINSTEAKDVFEYLKNLPTDELLKTQGLLKDNWFGGIRRYIGPVVEDSNADQPFITRDTYEILKSGDYNHVPLIMGYTSMEGIVAVLFKTFVGASDGFKDIGPSIPHILNYTDGSPDKISVGEKMKQFYLGGKNPAEVNDTDMFQMLSDVNFVTGIVSSIRHHVKTSDCPVYQYQFSWDLELNFIKRFARVNFPGAAHGDDRGYTWKTAFSPQIKEGSMEDIAIQQMVKLWTNFAKTGNPTPSSDNLLNVSWEPVNENEQFLNIGPNLQMETYPKELKDRLQFWKDIFGEHPLLKDYL